MADYSYWDYDNNDDFECFPYWFNPETCFDWTTYVDKQIGENEHNSPDLPELNKFDKHLVFVYGTLKKGKSNSSILWDSQYLGKAWTKLKNFTMVTTNGHIPAVLFNYGTEQKAIQGEIFKVTTDKLADLDAFEQNGTYYKRRRIGLETEYGHDCVAWMYFGSKEHFEGLKTCPTYVRKKDGTPYYTFNHKPRRIEY